MSAALYLWVDYGRDDLFLSAAQVRRRGAMMAKESGKVQAKSWQPPVTQTASKENFAARPFPEMARTEAGQEASLDRLQMKENQPGGMIENINRSLAAASPPELPTLGLGGVQAKLTLGAPGDVYEQEADRVARQVVDEIHRSPFQASNTTSEGESVANGGNAGRVQRQITVQAAGDAGGDVSSEWEAQLQGAKGGGQPLSPTVREPMERAFGADFGSVRVHTGVQADQLAKSIQAKAFTTRQDVFFRQGAYEPGSRGGQELIAHELTHVLQRKTKASLRSTIQCMKEIEGDKEQSKGSKTIAKVRKKINHQNVDIKSSKIRYMRRIQRAYGDERNIAVMKLVASIKEGNNVTKRKVKYIIARSLGCNNKKLTLPEEERKRGHSEAVLAAVMLTRKIAVVNGVDPQIVELNNSNVEYIASSNEACKGVKGQENCAEMVEERIETPHFYYANEYKGGKDAAGMEKRNNEFQKEVNDSKAMSDDESEGEAEVYVIDDSKLRGVKVEEDGKPVEAMKFNKYLSKGKYYDKPRFKRYRSEIKKEGEDR